MKTKPSSQKCSICFSENPDDARFCQNCGRPLMVSCPDCDTSNAPEAKFCKKCGTELNETADPEKEFKLRTLQQAAPKGLREKIRAAGSEMDGERKPVTILFTVSVGSTSIAEKLDPEEWKEVVNGAHRRVSEAVYYYEGTIAQLLGDGVLAFFGAPITHEDDPIRAVHAALDIQESIEGYSQELAGYVDDFQIRIGINTGTVVIGDIGTDLHVEYLAIGDAVNVAARLQSAAEPGKVLLSENSARLVKATFDLRDHGEIEVKGKAEPLTVLEVVGAKVTPESGRGIEGLHSPLIGREGELEELRSALVSLREGHGQIVVVMGEAGIGKSRLLEEASALTQQDEEVSREKRKGGVPNGPPVGFHWLEGRSLSYGSALSFWPITHLLLADLGLSDGDPEARIKVVLRRRMTKLFGEESSETFQYLSHLLGLKPELDAQDRIQQLDGETLKRQILMSVSEYFARMADKVQTVLVFEDLHWADPSSLETLEYLLALTDRVPLMILCLMRVDRDHGSWGVKIKSETDYAHRYREIHLQRLSPEESEQLVASLLEIDDLPHRTRDLIMTRSEGNPFYLEELIRNLIDHGVIVREDHAWRATKEIAEVTIPETLQGVLLARIDRLEEEVRSTLQMASVIGKTFLFRLLEAIAEAERQLEGHLSQLQRVDLVREKARWPELEYIFKHSLTQEAAYNSLLVERRRLFHLKVGEALEELFADRVEDFYGLLAHHFEAAEVHEKAVDYLTWAGDQRRLAYAHQEAIDYYQRALAILKEQEDTERSARTLMKLGLTYHNAFDFKAARVAHEDGFVLWQRSVEVEPAVRLPPAPHALRMNWLDPVTLDPTMGSDIISGPVIFQLFSGLVELTPELDILPDAAQSWEMLEGGRKYVFHLRDDLRWSDGAPLTAGDFEYAWKRTLDPVTGSPNPSLLFDVKGAMDFHRGEATDIDQVAVRAADEFTLVVVLEEPTGYFLHLLGHSATFAVPQHVVEKHGEKWTDIENIVTNGPFNLEAWNRGESLILSHNPMYRRRRRGNVARVELSVPQDPTENIAQYEDDHLDILNLGGLQAPEVDRARQRHTGEYVSLPWLLTSYVAFDTSQPPFDDSRVRRAFGLAGDRETLAGVILHGTSFPATGGFIPHGMPGHSSGINLPFDPQSARQLLAEAGFPGGKGFPEVKFLVLPLSETSCEYLQAQWREILGIEMRLEIMEFGMFFDKVAKEPPPIFFSGWAADYPDPDNFLRVGLQVPRTGWRNEAYDSLVGEARRVTDQAMRMKLYRQADRILVEEAPILPLTYGRYHLLVKPWISKLNVAAMGRWSWKDVIIEPH